MARERRMRKKHSDSLDSKLAVKYTKSFLDAQGLEYSHRQLFRHFGLPESTGRRLLKHEERGPVEENRGRKRLLSDDDVLKIEQHLYSAGLDARNVPWVNLPTSAGIDFDGSGHTVQRVLHDKTWRKCTICPKGWVSGNHAKERVHAATNALSRRPRPEDWADVRFSDETHLFFGPAGRPKALQSMSERPCPDCIQYHPIPERDQFRLHTWAAVGYNFKSDLVWYDAVNKNSAITMEGYIDQILKPVVKPWLDRGDQFTLEEDGFAAGHGRANNDNIVRRWKELYHLKHQFSAVQSPDLSPFEIAWRAPKAYMKEHAIWDDDALKQAAIEAWEGVSQDSINWWIHGMPQRLQDVINMEGQFLGY